MCSVCWEWRKAAQGDEPQLRVFFNRDEQRDRALGAPPQSVKIGSLEALMPIDVKRGGTWIGVNEQGLVMALLNNYAVPPIKGKAYDSRGEIVKCLLSCEQVDSIDRELENMVMNRVYPSFTVLAWSSEKGLVFCAQWNEEELRIIDPKESFFTSSSWNTQEVQSYRLESYVQNVVKEGVSMDQFMTQQPDEDRKKWSVRMSREKTCTVSASDIVVKEREIIFSYQDWVQNKFVCECLKRSLD